MNHHVGQYDWHFDAIIVLTLCWWHADFFPEEWTGLRTLFQMIGYRFAELFEC